MWRPPSRGTHSVKKRRFLRVLHSNEPAVFRTSGVVFRSQLVLVRYFGCGSFFRGVRARRVRFAAVALILSWLPRCSLDDHPLLFQKLILYCTGMSIRRDVEEFVCIEGSFLVVL